METIIPTLIGLFSVVAVLFLIIAIHSMISMRKMNREIDDFMEFIDREQSLEHDEFISQLENKINQFREKYNK